MSLQTESCAFKMLSQQSGWTVGAVFESAFISRGQTKNKAWPNVGIAQFLMANALDDLTNDSTHSWAWACSDFIRQEEVGIIYCNATHDTVSCWPPTKAGTLAVISCFPELNNIKYDVTENASKLCLENGTWSSSSNYTNCRPLGENVNAELDMWNVNRWTIIIYYIGFSVSLVALLVAIAILSYFKVRIWGGQMKSLTCRHMPRDLRCLRNTLHVNLMFTYVLVNFTWILTSINSLSVNSQSATCVLFICIFYFQGTNFFWMFVEGFYLYLLVVRTFQAEKVKFFVYMLIGWGAPVLVVGTWVIVKAELVGQVEDEHVEIFGQTATKCPWIQVPTYDYIYICPMILVLIVNIFFLLRIMWVLITKLRVSTSQESQQYRKAAKALLVLIPLLGVTYILIITAPDPELSLSAAIFAYIRALLLSTQGLTVSVLYCFINGEVRASIYNQWLRWRQQRSSDFSSTNKTSRSRFYSDNLSPVNPEEEEEQHCLYNVKTVPSRSDLARRDDDSTTTTVTTPTTTLKFGNGCSLPTAKTNQIETESFILSSTK